jgi:hypothetical protein
MVAGCPHKGPKSMRKAGGERECLILSNYVHFPGFPLINRGENSRGKAWPGGQVHAATRETHSLW